MGDVLADQFRTGRLHADEIAATASASARSSDAPAPADIQRLASASSARKRPRAEMEGSRPDTRHAARSVGRALAQFSILPSLYYFTCPLWDRHLNRQVCETVSMLLPTV